MTEYFSQKRIDEIRECFNLYSDEGFINSASQLRCILRSLGYSPTQQKIVEHFKRKRRPIDFASFLEIVHTEDNSGDPLIEIIRALRGLDREGRQAISAPELRNALSSIGERMSQAEIDAFFKQTVVNGFIPHQKIIQMISK